MLACGVSPGSSRLPCVALPSEKLTCLPEPLTPANGFSCNRQVMPYFSATRLSVMPDQLLMIGRQVRVFEDRGDFILCRSDFVVPRLDRDAELEQFALGVEHEGQYPLGNRAEIMVLEFLAFRRLRAEQGPPRREQVGPREVEIPVDQEVFLFRTRR